MPIVRLFSLVASTLGVAGCAAQPVVTPIAAPPKAPVRVADAAPVAPAAPQPAPKPVVPPKPVDPPPPRKDYGAQRPELRAFWVDGFNEGFKTPAQCDALLARVRQLHMNAVFVQMRKRADAYYRSSYEPWADDDASHFDALDYLVRHAHQSGLPRIQVHAWVNACAVGGNKGPRALPKLHPDWISLSDTKETFDSEVTKIDPGNPAAADWTVRVYTDIVRHYDVDGVHMDFIRYGGTDKTVGHWGYNPVSIARYNARYGTMGDPAWDDERWKQWRRDQVTALVRRVYASATAVRPSVIVSAATICWGKGPANDAEYEAKSASYTGVFAPWRDWMREGILDLDCSMTYMNSGRHRDHWYQWSAFLKDHQYGRRAAMGTAIYMNSIPESLWQINETRAPSPSSAHLAGTLLYSYASTDADAAAPDGIHQYNEAFYGALAESGIYKKDVPIPSMPWKSHPAMGIVQGVLLAPNGLAPRDGAVVTLRRAHGGRRQARADGNGFFAMIGVTPGAYQASWEDGGVKADLGTVKVHAGETLRITPGLPRRPVAGIGKVADGESVTLVNAVVTNGSNRMGDFFYVTDPGGKALVRVDSLGLVPPTVRGDLLAITGTVSHEAGVPIVKASAVRWLGARRD
ncbi:MAG: hypothetical protein JWQ02_1357 [Capsulimonas sp.]|nr:hypothetical protein [Capsulimonas sp.]